MQTCGVYVDDELLSRAVDDRQLRDPERVWGYYSVRDSIAWIIRLGLGECTVDEFVANVPKECADALSLRM